MQLNILVRGQSNAQILISADNYAGGQLLRREVQRLLGFDGVNDRIDLIYRQGDPAASTVFGGTPFLRDWLQPDGAQGWQANWMEQGLLAVVQNLTAEHRAAPTSVLWLHSEYDSMREGLTPEFWTSAVRYDAALLRNALGQGAGSTPYLFVSAHPFSSGNDAGHQVIRAGMEALAADPAFNARIAARALDVDADWDELDGDPATREYGGQHLSASDALLIVQRAARALAQDWAEYARPGSPVALAGGQIDDLGPMVASVSRAGPASLDVTVWHDASWGFRPLDADAVAGQGWSVRLQDGTVLQALHADVLDGDTLRLTFGVVLNDAGGVLHYGWGYGRLAQPGQPGQGNAVYDVQGLPVWTPAAGVGFGGPSPVPLLDDSQALDYIASHGDLSAAFGAEPAPARLHYATQGQAEHRAITFSSADYLASHDDLLASFGFDLAAAARHWIVQGRAEGRAVSFDGLDYVATYADLSGQLGPDRVAALHHGVQFGRAEGRQTAFEALEYTASYADLTAAFGLDHDAAARHWIVQGRAEGRSVSFDALGYVASYDDLSAVLGADREAGAAHWLRSGRQEGRQAGFDGLDYIAAYPDLIVALGADAAAGARHWITQGRGEGRVPQGFDTAQYMANYADLRAAFAADAQGAARHYILFGHAEGRTDDPL